MTEEQSAALKAAYRENKESLRSLAKRFDIPESTLRARAAREHWQRRASEHKPQTEPLAAARSCVDRLLAAVQEALEQETALQSTRQVKCKSKAADGADGIDRNWTEEEPTGDLDIGKVKEFAAVLDGLISLKRDLYDLPTGAEAERRQLAREKLEMARQKLEPTEAAPLRVLFSGETEDWSA